MLFIEIKQKLPRSFKKHKKTIFLLFFMIWYDSTWYDMIRLIMIQHDMTWYDMKWDDTIWYDISWYDMIQNDMAFEEIIPRWWAYAKLKPIFHPRYVVIGWIHMWVGKEFLLVGGIL